VLLHFARWYDSHIEQLTKEDTGGYNPRTIEGSTTLSNHASGTAEDLRWNKHPRGVRNTFSPAQLAAIHAQLKYYEGVIRWGQDYVSAPVDGMHFEINKAPSEVARIAKKIAAAAAPKPPTTPAPVSHTTSLTVDGQLGPKTITRWQQIMGTPVDGKISTPTSDLIKAVQNRLRVSVDHRLLVDGKLGPKTIAALQRYLKSPVDGKISTPKSQMVMALQRRLNTGKF